MGLFGCLAGAGRKVCPESSLRVCSAPASLGSSRQASVSFRTFLVTTCVEANVLLKRSLQQLHAETLVQVTLRA